MKRFSILLLAGLMLVSCRRGGNTDVEPLAPDYACADQWFVVDRQAGVDLFYITSTEAFDYTLDGAVFHHADTHNDSIRALLLGEMQGVDRLLSGDLNFYSPYYRQCTMEAYTSDSLLAARSPLALDDVRKAFQYYLTNMNGGRPFIIAGFSQGAACVVDLLKLMERSEGGGRRSESSALQPPPSDLLVAAYVIGWKVTDEDLAAASHIVAAQDSADLGVTVCFNSVRSPECAVPIISNGNRMAINPVNWRTDATPASLVHHGDTLTVILDTASLLLCVDGYSREDYMLPLIGCDGNYHCLDIVLYAESLRRNMALRSSLMK